MIALFMTMLLACGDKEEDDTNSEAEVPEETVVEEENTTSEEENTTSEEETQTEDEGSGEGDETEGEESKD